jgi:lysophospholipase L1-like esterase
MTVAAGVKLGLKRRLVFLAVVVALVGSVVLNVMLASALLSSYRRIQELALDPTDAQAMAPLNASLAQSKSDGRRVVLFGDSRIAEWINHPAMPDCEFINRGVGGQTTAQLLLRLDRDVIPFHPDVVVIEAGVNDLKNLGLFPERAEAIAQTCRDNLRAIIDRLREREIHVVVLTIFPVGQPSVARRWFWSDATVDAIDETNHWLQEINQPGVTVIDCDQVLRQGRYVDSAKARDLLHLNSSGYTALNARLAPAIERSLSGNEGTKSRDVVQ